MSESTNHVYPKAAAGEQSANVAPNPSFPKLEESVLDYWDKDGTFQKSIERRPSGDHSQNEFVFFDGPPFANGLLQLISTVQWIFMALAILGVLFVAARFLFSMSRGDGGQHVGTLGWWVLGASLVAGAVGFTSFIFSAASVA